MIPRSLSRGFSRRYVAEKMPYALRTPCGGMLTESDKEKAAEGFFEWAPGMSNVTITAQDFSQFGILELR